jgi:peptidoglycan/LPS O-acetylase OafA/YrhL
MFGTYRTLLALMVAGGHLVSDDGGGIGAFALIGFYILSGFLMTLIMQNNYGYTKTGVIKYSINRFLKIYPLYWMGLGISAILVFLAGEDFSTSLYPPMYLPKDTFALLRNTFIFFPFLESPRLIPPAWALTVELFFYILIGAGLSRNRKAVWCWFFLSALYHPIASHYGWDQYFSICAASLGFSMGALAYHHRSEIEKSLSLAIPNKMQQMLPMALFGWILLSWLLGYMLLIKLNDGFFVFFFYLNYPVCAVMVIILAGRTSLPLITSSIDKWVGELSYPIYLVHNSIGVMVSALMIKAGVQHQGKGFMLMIVSLPIIILAATILARLAGQTVGRIRSLIKRSTPA